MDEATYSDLVRLLTTLGMTPNPAKQHASRAREQGLVHVWGDGQRSVMIDGRIDSSSHALQNLAARIVAGAPSAERTALSYEEKRQLVGDKLQRHAEDYSL